MRAIPGIGTRRNGHGGLLLRLGGLLQRHRDANFARMLAEKMKHARATDAPVIVTANPGCLLQMRAGAEIHATGQEVVHVIELLDRAIS